VLKPPAKEEKSQQVPVKLYKNTMTQLNQERESKPLELPVFQEKSQIALVESCF
jgi:hypothetical protein